ncbi:MAG: NifU family protein [Acidimicrobiia bacterium]
MGDVDDEAVTMEQAVQRIQVLVERLEQHHDPEVVRQVFELLDWIDVLHREGLERLAIGLAGAHLLERAVDDPVVAHLFSIYGLLDADDVTQRVHDAMDEIRPYVRSHGGEMEFDSIEGGVVRVRMLGACDGCPSAIVTLTQSLERAIRDRWPGLVRIDVVDDRNEGWRPVTIRR